MNLEKNVLVYEDFDSVFFLYSAFFLFFYIKKRKSANIKIKDRCYLEWYRDNVEKYCTSYSNFVPG